jgi:flagellar basal-body rod protein FlgB
MDPTRTAPLILAERRLAWLDARQRVLAQNIANADTPRYQPRDLPDFAKVMAQQGGAQQGGAHRGGLALAQTDPRHLPPAGGGLRARPDRQAMDGAPNGNAVSLDQEAVKVAETDTAHALATNLHKTWLGMFGTAIGKQ